MKRCLVTLSMSACCTLLTVAILFAGELRLGVPGPYSFVIAPPAALAVMAALLTFGARGRARSALQDAPLGRSNRATRKPAVCVEGFVLFDTPSPDMQERRL